MKTIFQRQVRASLSERIARLENGTRPLWGTMNAQQMLAHLVASMKMAAGELDVEPARLPIRYTPLRQLLVYWMPWPKGLPTAPELQPADAGDLESLKRELTDRLDDLGSREGQRDWPEHPAFGPLGRRGWGVLGWRHTDHHLRQFGI